MPNASLPTSTASTSLAGLIGYPARYSLSPQLHEIAYRAIDFDARYLVFPVKPEDLKDAIAGARALGIVGLSVTVPHKQAVIKHLDELSTNARAIGAVNTVVNQDGELVGHNTDATGFIAGLRSDGFDPSGRSVAVIGAGGAARAVVVGLCSQGVAQLTIAGRTRANVDALVELSTQAGAKNSRAGNNDDIASADLIVNTTPVGMADSPGLPFNPELISSDQFVSDLIYAPLETKLLQAAKAKGARTANGISMLVHQARDQVVLFTGKTPPIETMIAGLPSDMHPPASRISSSSPSGPSHPAGSFGFPGDLR